MKRSLSCSIPDLAGGHGLGRDQGKKLHCESRGGTWCGFGPFAFCVDVFFFVAIVGHSRYDIPSGAVVSTYWRGNHDKTDRFFFSSFKSCVKTMEDKLFKPFEALEAPRTPKLKTA